MSLLYSILKPIVRLSVEGRARRFLFPPEKDFGELIRRPVNLPVMLYAAGITTLLHDCHERNAIYLPHAGSPVLDLPD